MRSPMGEGKRAALSPGVTTYPEGQGGCGSTSAKGADSRAHGAQEAGAFHFRQLPPMASFYTPRPAPRSLPPGPSQGNSPRPGVRHLLRGSPGEN